MRISDWSSDVCSSDLLDRAARRRMVERVAHLFPRHRAKLRGAKAVRSVHQPADRHFAHAVVKAHPHIAGIERDRASPAVPGGVEAAVEAKAERGERRSEEHTSELQSLMRISYAVFCLKKKKYTRYRIYHIT